MAPLAYVPNEGDGTISVIDTGADQVIAELPGGSKRAGWQAGPTGAGCTSAINPRKQVAQVAVGARPRGIGFLPDGSRAYVATENANEVFVIDTASFAVVTRIKAGLRANGIAVHPNGREVYVAAWTG